MTRGSDVMALAMPIEESFSGITVDREVESSSHHHQHQHQHDTFHLDNPSFLIDGENSGAFTMEECDENSPGAAAAAGGIESEPEESMSRSLTKSQTWVYERQRPHSATVSRRTSMEFYAFPSKQEGSFVEPSFPLPRVPTALVGGEEGR